MSEPGASELVEAVEDALIEAGPLSMDDLVDKLRAAGFTFGESPADEVFDDLELSDDDTITVLRDQRWAHVPSLLSGRVFTHRVTRSEIQREVLTLYPDLASVARWEDPFLSTTAEMPAEDEVLQLNPGTLAELGVQDGDLVGLLMSADGYDVDRVEDQELRPLPDRIRHWWLDTVTRDRPVEVDEAVLSLCADNGGAFTSPNLPLGELFAELGLAHVDGWLAPAGFDFQTYWAKNQVDRIAEDHDLSDQEALSVAGLLELYRRLTLVTDPADFASVATGGSADAGSPRLLLLPMLNRLCEPAVASALLKVTIGDHEEGAETLALMAETLEDQAARGTRPALRWLRARAYERLGRVADAEVILQTAEQLDPEWPWTLLDLARYASDRGDATRGLALLQRSDPYGNENLRTLLEAFRPQPGPTLGRNEPCWCGSGRKFKQCHLHQAATLPLEERAAWLYQKAVRFLQDGPWLWMVVELALERAAYAETTKQAHGAADDPLVGDVVLFEGGAFMEFVSERGFLLPDNEVRLAEQWRFAGRSVFEIIAVERGEGFTARDLMTGHTHVVRERTGSRSVKPGLLICARIVPAGATMQVFGGIEPVPLPDRDLLLELLDDGCEPEDPIAFLTRRFAPPTPTNADGDPLVARDVVLVVADPAD